ncbi:MAG TPA: type VI secretion system protein TssR domain-containing protein [Candidatus Acidoferrales bacterium]|nr:type VI secretion system protein TssR domain-containing protein [Candidatus Acidoferrales bacterium]
MAPTKDLLSHYERELGAPIHSRMNDITWIVFSDRDDDSIYTIPEESSFVGTIGFLTPLVVVAEKQEFIRVVKLDVWQTKGDNMTDSDVLGWIPKRNILLWPNECLQDKNSGIPTKGMIISVVAKGMVTNLGTNPKVLQFRRNPGTEGSSYTGYSANAFEFYHVFKFDETGGWVLLGKSGNPNVTMFGNDAEDRNQFVGWAPTSRVLIWSNRIVIEPNYISTAAHERINNIKATIFSDSVSALSYSKNQGCPDSSIIWNDDKWGDAPWPGERRRFPVLSYNPPVMHTGCIQPLTLGMNILDPNREANVRGILNEIIERTRHINVIFVIDGSASMRPYFDAARTAIKTAIGVIRSHHSRNTIRFGSVIYRNYSSGFTQTELLPLVGEDQIPHMVDVFLDPQKCTPQNPNDAILDDKCLFRGLSEAYRNEGENFNVKTRSFDETSLVVLIGGVGNKSCEERTSDMNELVQFMVRYDQPHFVAFQVGQVESNPAYGRFVDDVKEILDRSGRTLSNSIRRYFPRLGPFGISEENGFFMTKNTPFYGRIYPAENSGDSAQVIDNLVHGIVASIDSVDSLNTELINEAEKIESFNSWGILLDSTKTSIPNLGLLNKIRKEDKDILTFAAANVIDTAFQVFTDGFTADSVIGYSEPLYRFELFLSATELDRGLLDPLNQIINVTPLSADNPNIQPGTEQQVCMGLYNVFLELCRRFSGESEIEKLRKMPVAEVFQYVTGLPYKSQLMRDVPLEDVAACSDEVKLQLPEFIRYLELKRKLLYDLFNGPETGSFVFISNETKYFWVDEWLIP